MNPALYSAGVEATIRKRFSCRSFSSEPLSDVQRAALEKCLAVQADGLFDTRICFTLTEYTVSWIEG